MYSCSHIWYRINAVLHSRDLTAKTIRLAWVRVCSNTDYLRVDTALLVSSEISAYSIHIYTNSRYLGFLYLCSSVIACSPQVIIMPFLGTLPFLTCTVLYLLLNKLPRHIHKYTYHQYRSQDKLSSLYLSYLPFILMLIVSYWCAVLSIMSRLPLDTRRRVMYHVFDCLVYYYTSSLVID